MLVPAPWGCGKKAPKKASRYNGRSYRYPFFPPMPAILQRRPWLLVAAVAATLCLGACSGFSDRTRGALAAVTPYKVEVVQGNFVSKEQVAALKPGMSRQQVREILGTSLLNDVFHANRWDYVFTIRRQGVDPQERRLTVFFNGELMDRFQGDEMPSEEEFVATLDTRKKSGKVPPLEASEDELKKFAPAKDEKKAGTAADTSASLPPLPAAYPPLEAAR
jgi:outer membrane protein assembly factor BamE